MIWRNHCQPKVEYSAFKTIQMPAFHPLHCETNVSIMQMANGTLPAMVTRSMLQIYVAFIKWLDFPKLELSMPSPGLQDSAATSVVTITSKRFYSKPTGNTF